MTLKDKALELLVGLCLLIVVACDTGNAKNEMTAEGRSTKNEKKKKDKDQATQGFTVNTNYELTEVSKMGKKKVPESSGLEASADGNFWTHPDAGNEAVLYKVNLSGELL